LAGSVGAAGEVARVVPAAHAGRVEALFLARSRRRWGRFDAASGEVREHEVEGPGDEDLLNLAAVCTLAHGGAVYEAEEGQVPGGGPLAAVFRRPFTEGEGRP
jgi:hypothetical protein